MTKKTKPTKAEVEAMANWKKLNDKWDKLKFSTKPVSEVIKRAGAEAGAEAGAGKVPRELLTFKGPTASGGRETRLLESRITSTANSGQAATKVASTLYTGTKMLGIATLHKSVAVPVFEAQDAIDISQMRR